MEIRDVDAYAEVMDLQGELKVAQIEIRRLRKQLTLSGGVKQEITTTEKPMMVPTTAPRVSPTNNLSQYDHNNAA